MSNTLPPSFLSPEVVAALQAAAAAPTVSPKTLICFFLYGGNDAHNTLVPRGTNPNLPIYTAARPTGVRIEPGETLTLTPTWGLHPALTNFKAMFDGTFYAPIGSLPRLAVVRNVGTLNRPITKAEYLANPKVAPDQIFAHNIQQDIWQAADIPFAPRRNGWFGRTSDLVDPYFNANQKTPSSVFSSTSGAIQNTAIQDTKPFSSVPPTLLTAYANNLDGSANFNLNRDEITTIPLSLKSTRNAMHEAYSTAFSEARVRQAGLTDPTTGLVDFDTQSIYYIDDNYIPSTAFINLMINIGTSGVVANPWRNGLTQAARILLSPESARLNQRRQVIFIGVGGFDNHSTLRTFHDRLLQHLNNAVAAFMEFLDAYSLGDNVVMFTESEFSRTLVSNGTGGTDHAWAGHHFVWGKPVLPGLYGPEPDYTINGPRDLGVGRFIPDISIEQYYATLLKWFGVPEAQLPLILPNLPAFSPATLGFLPAS